MDATTYTGSDDELAEIVDEAWTSGSPSGVMDLTTIYAWRDAAVARRLAEAGAVHPKVHTPTRVTRWLEQHGWERTSANDEIVCWRGSPERVHRWAAYVPTNPKSVNYARDALGAISKVAFAEDVPLSQVLAEIAALPDEVAW